MSIDLKDLFNRIFRKKEKVEMLSEAPIHITPSKDVSNTNSSGSFETSIKEPQYTPASVRSCISSKQSAILCLYHDMGLIAALAEDAIYLPHPIRTHHYGKDVQEYEDKFNKDLDSYNIHFQRNIKTSKKLGKYEFTRRELFRKIREIYPDFCLDMEKKVSPEDFAIYKSGKQQLKKLTGFRDTPYDENTSSEELLLRRKDELSTVIDSKEFSKACSIEDSFVLSELETFFSKFNELPQNEQEEFSSYKITTKGESPISALKLAQKVRDDRKSRLEKYASIEKLYQKLDDHPYINLTVNGLDDER